MLAVAVWVGADQLLRRGPVVFVFFTVWNWWLLTAYFLVASVCSVRRNRSEKNAESQPADWLEKTALTLFHVVTPVGLYEYMFLLIVAREISRRRGFFIPHVSADDFHHRFDDMVCSGADADGESRPCQGSGMESSAILLFVLHATWWQRGHGSRRFCIE